MKPVNVSRRFTDGVYRDGLVRHRIDVATRNAVVDTSTGRLASHRFKAGRGRTKTGRAGEVATQIRLWGEQGTSQRFDGRPESTDRG